MTLPAFVSRYYTVNDTLMHARVSTNSPLHQEPTVMLLHGLNVSGTYMLPTARQLAHLYPVIVPDMPGFGKSTEAVPTLSVPELSAYLRTWIAAAGISDLVLVANSFGCEVALEYARQSPPELRQLAMVSPMKNEDLSPREYLKRWFVLLPKEPLSFYPIMVGDYVRAGLRRSKQTYDHALRDNTEEKLSDVLTPTLIVIGDKDPLVSATFVKRMQRTLADASYVYIRGAAHAINYSHPEELTRVIDAFIVSGKDGHEVHA